MPQLKNLILKHVLEINCPYHSAIDSDSAKEKDKEKKKETSRVSYILIVLFGLYVTQCFTSGDISVY